MFTKEQHEAIVTDVDKFNQFIIDYTETIMQRVMLEIPNIVLHHIKDIKETTKLRENFYNDFPELKDKPDVLIKTVTKTASDHPEWDRNKVFTEAGKQAKKLLSMEIKDGQGF